MSARTKSRACAAFSDRDGSSASMNSGRRRSYCPGPWKEKLNKSVYTPPIVGGAKDDSQRPIVRRTVRVPGQVPVKSSVAKGPLSRDSMRYYISSWFLSSYCHANAGTRTIPFFFAHPLDKGRDDLEFLGCGAYALSFEIAGRSVDSALQRHWQKRLDLGSSQPLFCNCERVPPAQELAWSPRP